MHDKNGKLVEIGDIVMGKGHKHDIIGPVLNIVPGCTSCDMQVGVIEVIEDPHKCQAFGRLIHTGTRSFVLLPGTETHTASDFEIIQKADGTDAV